MKIAAVMTLGLLWIATAIWAVSRHGVMQPRQPFNALPVLFGILVEVALVAMMGGFSL